MAKKLSSRRWAAARAAQYRPRPVPVEEEWWLAEGQRSDEEQWTGDSLRDFLTRPTEGDLSSDR